MTPSGLTCAFGVEWLDHLPPPAGTGRGCQACALELARAREAFAADVAAGVYDADGFTPAERRAQAKKRERR